MTATDTDTTGYSVLTTITRLVDQEEVSLLLQCRWDEEMTTAKANEKNLVYTENGEGMTN